MNKSVELLPKMKRSLDERHIKEQQKINWDVSAFSPSSFWLTRTSISVKVSQLIYQMLFHASSIFQGWDEGDGGQVTTSSFLIPPLATFFLAPPLSPSATLPTSINSLSILTLSPVPLVPPLAHFPAIDPAVKPAPYLYIIKIHFLKKKLKSRITIKKLVVWNCIHIWSTMEILKQNYIMTHYWSHLKHILIVSKC